MDVMPVDPRDQTWEVAEPRYRVYFWDGSRSTEFELTASDVHEAHRWAEENRGDRTFTLYASVPVDGLGLVRLSGLDPSAGAGVPAS